jgi:hypothetical protein
LVSAIVSEARANKYPIAIAGRIRTGKNRILR